ncbi:MAG: hypothetical protein EAZ95_20070 [Bacteroidetes bacterium]|nr:MAG: hypothetical protein EAZ95_20070 [Bacteroidota bacterium]
MKITTLEFTNYRAFYGTHTLALAGKNALIYGENGSGKSSLYEGLKQFFASANPANSPKPALHLQVPTTQSNGNLSQVSVQATFEDKTTGAMATHVFGEPNQDTATSAGNFIGLANELKGFLSYRELLRTHLIDDIGDRDKFQLAFGSLLVKSILANHVNSVTNNLFLEDDKQLNRPKGRGNAKKREATDFDKGLEKELRQINLIFNEILQYFDKGIKVTLKPQRTMIDYKDYIQPFYRVDVEVELFGVKVQNHLEVLNEARLSAIAISIYLASLTTHPKQNTTYKMLFLDDIFVGLDMSNRLPLLDILTTFQKPKIIQGTNEAGEIAEIVERDAEGKAIAESATPFFADYQIFMTTYDRHWFGVAKQWFENKAKDKWKFFELYVDDFTNSFDVPFIQNSESPLSKAMQAEKRFDYASAGNYLRKAVEELLNNKFQGIILKTKEGTDIEKMAGKLQAVIAFLDSVGVDSTEFRNIGIYTQSLMNPLSHYDIDAPIFKQELKDVITALQNLQNFPDFRKTKILLKEDENILFKLQIDATTENHYLFKLEEAWLGCKTTGQTYLKPIKISSLQCWEVKNGRKGTENNFMKHKKITLEDAINKIVAFENAQNSLSLAIPNHLTACYGKNKTLQSLIDSL